MTISYLLIVVTLLVFAGMALDGGMVERRNLLLQNAADAAAQEGMYERGKNNSGWLNAAQAQATANGFTDGSNGVSVTIAQSTTGAITNDTVKATLTQTVPTLFMGLVGAKHATVAASATAQVIPTCVWIMNPSGSGSSFWLASTTLRANCGVFVNKASGTNLTVDGFAGLLSYRTRVVGPASSNNSSGWMYPPARFGAAPKNDPLAYVVAPTFSSCNVSNASYSNQTLSLTPGTYCGVSASNCTITLNAGLYIFAGGLSLHNSKVDGTAGVTLYFTKGGSFGYGSVSIDSNDSNATQYPLNLKAPVNSVGGGIPGIVIFADRGWVAHGSQPFSMQYIPITTDGFWYLPNIGLYLWTDRLSYFHYNGLVIDNLYQYGPPSFFNANYADLGGISPLHYEDGVLVQ